ncbi:MAG: peptidase E [Nanoarchaeota archaeon]
MGKIVAIGGGEIKDLETLAIDREIIKLTGKKHPRALFIPTASNDAEGYWKTFQEIYGKKLGCKPYVLYLVREHPSRETIRQKIFSADLIYVGGGNTVKMLKIWKRHGVDKLLKRAQEEGTILSGLSAGAVCWFRYGTSDFRRNAKNPRAPLSRISGLDFVHASVSPHHIREKDRTPALKKMMKMTPGVAFAIDDNAALEIVDDGYRAISSKPGSKVHLVYYSRGKLHYEILPQTKEFFPLEDILRKN